MEDDLKNIDSDLIDDLLDEIHEDEKKNAQQNVSYTYMKAGEYKGTGYFDKYKPHILKVRADGIFECYDKNNKKCKFSIHLLKEPWSDLKEVVCKGNKNSQKSCWEFQYEGKAYNFAAANNNERASIMHQLKRLYDKQESMNKSIEASGKYNRDKPNNDDFKEVQIIFDQSNFPQYKYNYSNYAAKKEKEKQRTKDASQYWYALKQDPNWKGALYLLKELHGISEATIQEQLVVMKRKEEEQKSLLLRLQNKAQEITQDQMEKFMTQIGILAIAMKASGFKATRLKVVLSIPPALSCTIKNVNDKKKWNDALIGDENEAKLNKVGRLFMWALKQGDKARQQVQGTALMFKSFRFVCSIPPKIDLEFSSRPKRMGGGGGGDDEDEEEEDEEEDEEEED